jgi:hypothetical protein
MHCTSSASLDPLVADVCLEVALDDLSTDDEHSLQYVLDFQKL